MTKKKTKNFEESLLRLQEISELLESDDVTLEESISLYEEGIILSNICYELLDKAELKVTELKTQFENKMEK
ncbi:MAG: exodeoxyribonuclease VII small subunit [Ignavibacteriae bacterium]|jgi:exodeoxyribonuclease VII small subunit|nr:exodeoxyribonuclease VII small subunit [Ignavibacteriota bacterium]NOG96727.1 exodeoxyribonuclease VII small subunit [Ignavibacteriota bacterium]